MEEGKLKDQTQIGVLKILGDYRELKDRLGCDPMIVLKALENGIYYRFDEKSEATKTRKPMLRIIDNEFCFIAPKWITTTWMNVKLKEHGKTWALTKEELS